MQDPANELPRIPIPRTPVNRAERCSSLASGPPQASHSDRSLQAILAAPRRVGESAWGPDRCSAPCIFVPARVHNIFAAQKPSGRG
jgi:hypothetical protein